MAKNSYFQVDAIVSPFKNANTHGIIFLTQGIARGNFCLQFKMEHTCRTDYYVMTNLVQILGIVFSNSKKGTISSVMVILVNQQRSGKYVGQLIHCLLTKVR